MAEFEHYVTSAEFSDFHRPVLKEVTVPESIKRRLPSKHYVFKMVVKWSNGSKTVVYRRYSLFFDFLVKLQELVSNLCQKNPKFAENPPQLPELPGKVLFGRTQIHQVAEKRRVKIEEFCQYLVSLPPEISESNLVLSFFNTWPDDTLQRPDITSPTSSKGRTASDPPQTIPPVLPSSPTSPTTSNTSSSALTSASDAIISHPDEMENLEQYRVLGDYQRKDSHQVNLTLGQIVHVIEKHDTGWWMVMSEDEQGYAPAAFLEPLEEGNREDVHPEGETSEVYEAMESYVPQNDDEVGFMTGDKIEVLSKSMDGWWKIRCNGRVGYSPSTLIRRRTLSSSRGGLETIYESEKSIYEGLNIHKPPPRRNTIDKHKIYDIPRPVNPVSVQLPENPYADPAEMDSDEEPTYYRIPKSAKTATISGEKEVALKINGQPSKSWEDSKSISSSSVGSLGPKQPPPPLQSFPRQNSSDQPYSPSAPQTLVYPMPAQPQNEPVYEMEPGPIYENTGDKAGSPPVYENTQVSLKQYKFSQKSPPPVTATRGNLPDYEDMDGEDSTPPPPQLPVSTAPPPQLPVSTAPTNLDDYIDMDGKDSTPSPLPPPPLPTAAINHDDYVDIDADNTYINPYELRQSSPSARESLTSQPSEPAIKPPPLPPTPPPKHKPKQPQFQTPSLSFGGTPILDGEYIEMDPIYFEPPEEDEEEKPRPLPTSPLKPSSNQITTPAKTKGSRPLPPPPYSEHRGMKTSTSETMPTRKSTLTRTKSVEDFLSSSSPREHHIPRQHSPPLERRKQQLLTQLPLTGIKQLDVGSRMTTGFTKPKPARIIAGKTRKVTPERMLGSTTDTLRTDLQRGERIKPHPPPRNTSPHHPVTHTVSEPFRSRDETDAPQVKTYIALSSYTSQAAGCISFSIGDKCVLVQGTKDDKWWLVNIGGKEGWAPANYWQEDMRPRVLTNVRPPNVPPQPLPIVHKLRSATVATDEFSSSLDFRSSTEQTLSDSSSSSLTKSFSGTSSEVEKKAALSASMEDRKPLPSSKPVTGKAKGPPPAKPKPFPGIGSPLKRKDKPRPPPKPTSHPSTSPTRGSEEKVPLLPPLSTMKKGNSHQTNGTFENSTEEGDALNGTYSLLEDTRTVVQTTPIEKASWFVGKMERGQAEQFLMEHGRQREFLVRERTARDGYYALSIRYHYSCKHFNIDPKDGQFCMGALTFSSIEEVIRHYQQNSLFIHDNQHVTLGQPVRKKTRHSVEKHSINAC